MTVQSTVFKNITAKCGGTMIQRDEIAAIIFSTRFCQVYRRFSHMKVAPSMRTWHSGQLHTYSTVRCCAAVGHGGEVHNNGAMKSCTQAVGARRCTMTIITLLKLIAGSRVFLLARSHRRVARSSAQKTLRTDRRAARGGATKRTGSLAPGCSATQGGTIVALPNQDTKKQKYTAVV